MSPPTSPPTERVIAGRYRILHRLATGGMAEVWLAEDLSLQRQVAIKILKASLASDATVAERFRREAKSAASLSHANIVAVYDTIDAGDRLAVVMQYVPGKSLRQTLDEREHLSPEMVIRIARAVAGALDHAHSKGIVHRDVKPGNIMLTPDNQVLLTDFGIAKAASDSGGDLTRDDVMMGTAKYISPEQVRGKRLDGRADLYSLGLVLYECLAGKVPFHAVSDVDMALARLQRDPTPLGRYVPTAAPGLIELIHRLLSRDPNDRPASGKAVQATLDTVVASLKRRDHTPTGDTGNVPRDHTPVRDGGRGGRPARGFQQRFAPSGLVIGGLLLLALLIGSLLWKSFAGDDAPATPPPSSTETAAAPTVATTAAPTGPRTINGLQVFDPLGNGGENDTKVDLVSDGDVTTAWTTVCYDTKYLNGKAGVGVIVNLEGSASSSLNITMGDLPYRVLLYTSAAEAAPTDIDAWGDPAVTSVSDTEPTMSLSLADPSVRHVLVWITELARPERGCSNHPWRAAIAEIALTAS